MAKDTTVPINTESSDLDLDFDQLEAGGAQFILHNSDTGQSLKIKMDREDLIKALIQAASPNSLSQLFKDRSDAENFRSQLKELL